MRVVRRGADAASQRASTLELFYDLVFVFAITQVSHLLVEHLTWAGAGQALIVLMAVYWSWNYTTWTTNELDTDEVPVRLLLLTLMLVSLLMAVAIPQAFEGHALLFAASYVAIQVGRHSFLAFAAAGRGTPERERAERILIYFLAAGVFWISGALFDGPLRIVLWCLALAVDYGAPLALFRVPGLRRMSHADWSVGAEHMAERFGLFIILALGESIVLTGATTSGEDLVFERLLAFGLAFVLTATIWWLYFTSVSRIGERYLESAPNRTLVARDAFTFLHVFFVAGIILSAVGEELVIAHPTDVLPPAEAVAVAAGPAVYLLAQILFGLRLTGSVSPRKTIGALACAAAGVLGLWIPALFLLGLLILILVAVAVAGYLAEGDRTDPEMPMTSPASRTRTPPRDSSDV